MDKNTIIELAESEVFESDQYDYNPFVRGFKSFFSDEIPPRFNDLTAAINYYESLSDDLIERRYSIHYWEVCAIGCYDSLHFDCMDSFYRSIDKSELARREIKNVDLLLNEGKCQILPEKSYLLINEIPILYEKLINGTWPEFFNNEELEAYESAHGQHGQEGIESISQIYHEHEGKDTFSTAFKDWYEQNKVSGPMYVDFFNSNWVAAMQIQSLIWYKNFLKTTVETGTPYHTIHPNENHNETRRTKTINMKTLRRSNEGYEAITTSFNNFVSINKRPPNWSELMLYMVDAPHNGFVISGKKRGNKIDELTIEGMEKPIDRAAFKKRYERYFRKSDSKQDINDI